MKLINKLMLGVASIPFIQANAQNERPNIIIIMTDQQSYNTISAHSDLYGGSYFSTLNIDRLANQGIYFTRPYCENPVSVPPIFALFLGHNVELFTHSI